MVAALESELGIKAILENDANAAALGESWCGASKGYANSILLTLGTGIGGGIIIGVLGTKAHFFTLSSSLIHKICQFPLIFVDFRSNFFVFDVLLHIIHAYNVVCMQCY